MSAKSLEKLLKPSHSGDLGDVIRRAHEMGELTTALASALPAEDTSLIAVSEDMRRLCCRWSQGRSFRALPRESLSMRKPHP